MWYGFGRGRIEGLRTDILYFFLTPIRISQLLGFASALVAAGFLIYHLVIQKHTPEELYVNRMKRKAEGAEAPRPQTFHDEEEQHGSDSD